MNRYTVEKFVLNLTHFISQMAHSNFCINLTQDGYVRKQNLIQDECVRNKHYVKIYIKKCNTIWKQFVEAYFFSKVNIDNMLN